MDFTLSEEQQAISDLAAQILTEKLPPERLREIESSSEGVADDVWIELAKANLLGIALPEDVGGSGFGILEACLVLEQIGKTVAPVPYLPTVVLGAMTIAEFGSDAQRRRDLPGVVDGEVILTAAIAEEGVDPALGATPTTAAPDGGEWVLDGARQFVPALHVARRVLVPARTGDGNLGVFLVDPSANGVEVVRLETTSLEPQFLLKLSGVRVPADDVLGDPSAGEEILTSMLRCGTIALCATQAGVCATALQLTAGYVSQREQFGSKIATFQAVAQRAADAYIDTEAIRLTSRQAAWRLAEGLDADEAIAVAKFWAAEGGQRVVHAAQHLHGGIGVDVDYPLHRYFRWAKQLELSLGGTTQQLRRLGRLLASQ
jgi:alkylation response protein AidB-like acyl-CoA dehydrogenase